MEKIEVKIYGDLFGILNNPGLARLLKCKLMPIKVLSSLNRFVYALKSTPAAKSLLDIQESIQKKVTEINEKYRKELNEKLKLAGNEIEEKQIRKTFRVDDVEINRLNKEFNDELNKKIADDENANIDIDKAIISMSDLPTPEDTKKYFIDLESSKTEIQCKCGEKIKINSFNWIDQIIDGEVITTTMHFIDWKD